MFINNEPKQERRKNDQQLAESKSQKPMPSIWYT